MVYRARSLLRTNIKPPCEGLKPVHYSSLPRLSKQSLRANPFPEVSDLTCRLPLLASSRRPEAANLGDPMRSSVRPASEPWPFPRVFAVRPPLAGPPDEPGGSPARRAPSPREAIPGRGGRQREKTTPTGAGAAFPEFRRVAARSDPRARERSSRFPFAVPPLPSPRGGPAGRRPVRDAA